ENARVNGELSEEDAKVLQREIEQNSGVLEGVEQDRQTAFNQAQSEKDAHDYITDNNGQVFNENDVSDAKAAYDTASDNYSNAINDLEQMESDRKAVSEQAGIVTDARSEEHTSELQSRFDLVCRLLLEKKKTTKHMTY